jgi:AcrR family transcriptional regulator
VYRYFPGTGHLFSAVAQVAVETFVDQLTEHLKHFRSPAAWVVEALAFTIERLPSERYLTLLLDAGRSDWYTRGFTASVSIETTRELFKRAPFDWVAAGYPERELDELAELLLRVTQSMVIDPPDPPRSGRQLRRYLRRWIGPAMQPGLCAVCSVAHRQEIDGELQ